MSEVASVGGFVKEYQIDVDPDAMKIHRITLEQVMAAVKGSNIDIGAQTMEINLAEYFVRGWGTSKCGGYRILGGGGERQRPRLRQDVARVNILLATRRGAG